jgi:hypothetical protein
LFDRQAREVRGESHMTKYLTGVLTVIAVGVLLIAYGLLSPRASAFGADTEFDAFGRPFLAGARGVPADRYLPAGLYSPSAPYPAAQAPGWYWYPGSQAVYGYDPNAALQPAYPAVAATPVRTVTVTDAPRRVVQRVERAPTRDWKKMALVIGGSTAGGAGIGGLFGGKKGALIGAAIGGGASTIYEATK